MFESVSSPPVPVIRLDYPLLSRQKLGSLIIHALALLVAAACGFWVGRSNVRETDVPTSTLPATSRPSSVRSSLSDRTLRGNEQIGDIAHMLSGYASTRSRSASGPGPRIVDFQTRLPDVAPRQLNYLLAADSNGTPYQGQLSFEVAGLRNGRVEVLRAPGPEATVAGPERLQLSFSRYVRTEGSVLLPPGFTPLFVGASLPSAGTGPLKKLACPS